MSGGLLLGLRDVKKSYAGRTALEVDRLQIASGDSWAVTGENGSGKSTLLRLIAGLISDVDYGEVHRSPEWSDLAIGYMPQRGGLHRDLTIAENEQVLGRLLGRKPHAERSGEVAETLGIYRFLRMKVGTLSGGWQRLAALYVFLGSGASALILDEPFASVDGDKRERAWRAVKRASSSLSFLVLSLHGEDGFLRKASDDGAINAATPDNVSWPTWFPLRRPAS